MDPIRTIRLRWTRGAVGDVTFLTSFSQFAPSPWQPAINAFRCKDSIRICVELAGVDTSGIDLTVERHRLILRGEREVPEPPSDGCETQQTLALEIDYGSFLRVVRLPEEVDAEGATAEQNNGLLWITLPIKK